jgi:hypothetical protein
MEHGFHVRKLFERRPRWDGIEVFVRPYRGKFLLQATAAIRVGEEMVVSGCEGVACRFDSGGDKRPRVLEDGELGLLLGWEFDGVALFLEDGDMLFRGRMVVLALHGGAGAVLYVLDEFLVSFST